MYIAKGNTYQAKDALNKIGFVWNREAKRWESDGRNSSVCLGNVQRRIAVY